MVEALQQVRKDISQSSPLVQSTSPVQRLYTAHTRDTFNLKLHTTLLLVLLVPVYSNYTVTLSLAHQAAHSSGKISCGSARVVVECFSLLY